MTEVCRRISDGVIVQHGIGIGDMPGCVKIMLDDALAALLEKAYADNQRTAGVILSGITIDPDGRVNGKLTALPAPPLVVDVPKPNIPSVIAALLASPSLDVATRAALIAALQGQ